MTESVLYRVALTFAVVTGTAGFVLTALAWLSFRGSPFGRVLAVLPVFTAGFTAYHAIVLVEPGLHAAVEPLGSAAFLLLVAFATLAVQLHRRMSVRPVNEEEGA